MTDRIQNIVLVGLTMVVLGFMVYDFNHRAAQPELVEYATVEMLEDFRARTLFQESEIQLDIDILQERLDNFKLHDVEDDSGILKELRYDLTALTSKVEELSKPQVKVAPETFAQFVAREYRGVDYVEVGSNDTSPRHLNVTHNWPLDEVSELNKQQRRRVHGASHTGKVEQLRRQYKAKYNLSP